MGSVIFDFDSTLILCESLEALAEEALGPASARLAEIERITAAGMDGGLSFEDSLRRRLKIVTPTRDGVGDLGVTLAGIVTHRAAHLVASLQEAGHEVWIVSGGFQEILLIVGRSLGVPDERIQGVRCRWGPDGRFLDLDARNGFVESKVEGVRRLGVAFPAPSVGVGDGATDLALRQAGLVEHFVAYTEHARRPAVVEQADFEAANMEALGEILRNLLG